MLSANRSTILLPRSQSRAALCHNVLYAYRRFRPHTSQVFIVNQVITEETYQARPFTFYSLLEDILDLYLTVNFSASLHCGNNLCDWNSKNTGVLF